MSCPFAIDDGAYVLGALAPAERAEFERHMASCQACRDAVASLAVLPGLLGRLDAATATATAGAATAGAATPGAATKTTAHSLRTDQSSTAPKQSPGALDRLLSAAAQERTAQHRAGRMRRLRYVTAACVAAIVLAAGVGFGVHALEGREATVAMSPMVAAAEPVRVTAEIGVIAVDGGSQITMTCRYPGMTGGPWTVRLVVFGRASADGDQVGSLTAAAGEEYTLTATTHLSPDEIDRIELQRANETPMLIWKG